MPSRTRKRPPANRPHKVLHLTTYDRLEAYLRAFAEGHFHLLILVGTGGLAKSRSVRAALGGQGCWIEGNATPFGMYVKLYRHRDQFVVIDDVDALYADRSGVRLLKCLCQTEEEKAVAWHSDARTPGAAGHPAGVHHQEPGRHHLQRLEDAQQERGGAPGPRACALVPAAAAEVHRKAGKWFDDREIYEWFGNNLHRVREPSLRHYVRARELKAAGMDWTEVLAAGRRQPGAARRRAAGQRCLRQHRRAGQGVRRAGRRVPGDVFQLPPLSSEVDNAGYVATLLTWPSGLQCHGFGPSSLWTAT